jgi:hypothetical protein
MTTEGERSSWPGPEYVVRQRFHAPLEYVFDWCTDFSTEDPALEKEAYERRVLTREPRHVVYEDLYPSPEGWMWSRQEVTLRPPDRWHMESVGNRRKVIADYALRSVAPGVVELELRYRRRPSLLKFTKLPKLPTERGARAGWGNFARALERDFRRSSTPKRRRGP